MIRPQGRLAPELYLGGPFHHQFSTWWLAVLNLLVEQFAAPGTSLRPGNLVPRSLRPARWPDQPLDLGENDGRML